MDSLQSLSKVQWHFSKKQKILKFEWHYKRLSIAQAILQKKKNDGGITLLNLKLYYKAVVTKTVWYWHKDRQSRIKTLQINPHLESRLIFDRSDKNKKSDKSIVSSIKGIGKTGYPHAKEWTSQNKQMRLHQCRCFCTAKETIKKIKRQPYTW